MAWPRGALLAAFFALGSHAQGPATGFRFFDAKDAAAVPKRLSETGLFQDIAGKKFSPASGSFT